MASSILVDLLVQKHCYSRNEFVIVPLILDVCFLKNETEIKHWDLPIFTSTSLFSISPPPPFVSIVVVLVVDLDISIFSPIPIDLVLEIVDDWIVFDFAIGAVAL